MPTWVGGAPAVKQITTLTVAGTPGSTETLTVTCNSKSMVVTLPAGQTTSQVATEIAASLMANSQTDPAPATGYTRSVGGREIPEFRDFTAEASGSTVILSSLVAGTPFTVTLAESMASGTFTQAATQAATGPNHVDNLANYRDGALPVSGDTVLADGAVDMLYGLTYFSAGTIDCNFRFDISKYTGQIGLPPVNVNGSYDEYRQRYLVHYCVAGDRDIELISESGIATSSKPIYITPGASNGALRITGSRGSVSEPNIVLYATGPDEFTAESSIARGSVYCDQVNFQEVLFVGENSGSAQDCQVTFESCDFTDTPDLWFFSGSHVMASATAYTGGGSPTKLRLYGGTMTYQNPPGNQRDVEVFGNATLAFKNTTSVGNTPDIDVYSGGTCDLRKASALQSLGLVNLHAGSSFYDPQGLAGNGTNNVYQFKGCSPSQVSNLQLPANLKYTTAVLS